MPIDKANRIITDTEHLVYANTYARIYDNDVTFPGNFKGRYLKFDWIAPYSIGILPVLEDGKIYLVHNFRYASDEWSIEVPKGFGCAGVSPAEMAMRELREEAGLTSNDVRHIASLKTDANVINHLIHLFVAYNCCPDFAPAPEESEVFESPVIVTCDEAIALVRDGNITDSLTVNALMLYYYPVFR